MIHNIIRLGIWAIAFVVNGFTFVNPKQTYSDTSRKYAFVRMMICAILVIVECVVLIVRY